MAETGQDAVGKAYEQGKRAGFAMAALAASLVVFVNLIGLEKAVFALLLAFIARKGMVLDDRGRRLSRAALIITVCYIVGWIAVMAWMISSGRAAQFIRFLQQQG